MFEHASLITNARFADLKPLNVFHREHAPFDLPKDASLENRHILFRKVFSLREKTAHAVLTLSADDYYKLYVNGTFVTQGPAPGYHFHYYANAVDITAYLHPGNNVIAVHTYYQGLINRVWVSGDQRHMFVCSLEADGKEVLVSDTAWKTREHSGYTAPHVIAYATQFAEDYDSRSPEESFASPDYDDSGWDFASVRTCQDYTFFLQPTRQLEIYDQAPVAFLRAEHEDGTSLIRCDMGQEMVGGLHLRAHGNTGSVITLRCGEELNADGSVRYQMRCNCNYEEHWTLSGADDELLPYDYKGFRYFELLLPAGCVIRDEEIHMQVRHYPFSPVISCPVRDPVLRDIWKLCENTIHYAVQEVYMDCPTREKGQYLGDGTVSSAAHLLLTGDGAMMKKALYEYARSTFVTPSILSEAPCSFMQEIADYSMQYPYQLLWYEAHTGDRETLAALAPYAEGALAYFRKFDRGDGLLSAVDTWNLVDWPENLRDGYDFPLPPGKPAGEGSHAVINAFWYGMVRDCGKIRRMLGEIPDTAYEEQVRTAFIREFYDPARHLFTDAKATDHTSAHANLLPLYFGLDVYTDDPEARPAIVELLRRKGIGCMGVYMSYFLLSALKKAGADDAVYELLTSPDGWCNMLAEGATTTLEAWGKDQKSNTSFMHPWACAPLLILGDSHPLP